MTKATPPTDWDLYLDPPQEAYLAAEPAEEAPDLAARPAASARHTEVNADTAYKGFLRLKLANVLLSPKTQLALHKHGVQTLGHLVRLTAAELAELPDIGRKGQAEIAEVLDYYDLALCPQKVVPSPASWRTGAEGREAPGSPQMAARRTRGTRRGGSPPCLFLPELDAVPPTCPACQNPLPPRESNIRFCSRACEQKHRPKKGHPAVEVPVPTAQVAFEF